MIVAKFQMVRNDYEYWGAYVLEDNASEDI